MSSTVSEENVPVTLDEIEDELLEDFLGEFPEDVREHIDGEHMLVSVEVRAAYMHEESLEYDEMQYNLIMSSEAAMRGVDVIDTLFSPDEDDISFEEVEEE